MQEGAADAARLQEFAERTGNTELLQMAKADRKAFETKLRQYQEKEANRQKMKPCIQCGAAPQLQEKAQAYTGSTMFFYGCPCCGYRTGYGMPGHGPNGITVTREQAIDIARRKWEQDITPARERAAIKEKWRPRK